MEVSNSWVAQNATAGKRVSGWATIALIELNCGKVPDIVIAFITFNEWKKFSRVTALIKALHC